MAARAVLFCMHYILVFMGLVALLPVRVPWRLYVISTLSRRNRIATINQLFVCPSMGEIKNTGDGENRQLLKTHNTRPLPNTVTVTKPKCLRMLSIHVG